ncbi:MAG: MarR family transcriptional regulator [Nannocystaceae bacterium]|nr:MarR family transcriptional regulator [bacterium]
MALQPRDVLVALKLALREAEDEPSYAALAADLGLSSSQVHVSVGRAALARLVDRDDKRARFAELREFLLHGIKYMCPAEFGPVARGIPTAHSAAPLRDLLVDSGEPLVWADPQGELRGQSIEPLHRAAPGAALRDARLHAGLALIDALRGGRARERKLAAEELGAMLRP